jgi:CDP-2,3-bis-(O-geranylgeranyl)-sn-glycerol synthase
VAGELSMGQALGVLAQAIWIMLPAYVANPAAQLTGGGLPMDFGRIGRDGQPILGEGKTWRGLAGGVLGGLFTGSLQIAVAAAFDNPSVVPTFSPDLGPAGPGSFLVVFALALGALLGDAVKSFAKRRMRLKRGANLPLADQYDFVLGAWVFTMVLFPSWFVANLTVGAIVAILLVTFFMHRAVSVLGYRMGLKSEPW